LRLPEKVKTLLYSSRLRFEISDVAFPLNYLEGQIFNSHENPNAVPNRKIGIISASILQVFTFEYSCHPRESGDPSFLYEDYSAW
jgi:hypothetical protein